MLILYSIVLLLALVGAIVCCVYIIRCSDSIDHSEAYHYDADDYLTVDHENRTD